MHLPELWLVLNYSVNISPLGYSYYPWESSCLTTHYCSLRTQEAGFSKFLPVISQMSSSWNSCSDVHLHLFILTIFQWHSHLSQRNPPPLFGILFTSHLSRSDRAALLFQSCWRRLFSASPLTEHPLSLPAISPPECNEALLMSAPSTQPQSGRGCDLFHTKKAANRGDHSLGLLCHSVCDGAFR